MKRQHSGWLTTAMMVTTSLVIANLAQAQSVTGTQYLSNIDPSTLTTAPNAVYGNWTDANTTISSIATGLEVANVGNGSGSPETGALYYQLSPSQLQTLSANDAFATFTITVNGGDQADYVWGGMTLILNDSKSNSQTYNIYSGDGNPGNPSTVNWSGNTLTETLPLDSTLLTDIQAGNDSINGITLGFYPATLTTPGNAYDITFNSLALSVPEPAPLTLAGLGASCLWFLRRRK